MAPVPTVKMRVLRGFYLNKIPQPVGAIVDVPVNISRQLVTDRKAKYVKAEVVKEEVVKAEPPPVKAVSSTDGAARPDAAARKVNHR